MNLTKDDPRRRHKGLSKRDFAKARRIATSHLHVGWSPPHQTRRRSEPFRTGPGMAVRASRTPERAEYHRARAAAFAAEPPAVIIRRTRTDGKGRGRSPWQGRLGTLIG